MNLTMSVTTCSSEPDDVSRYIMNPVNKPITERYVIDLLAKYKVKVKKVSHLNLFQRAMTHSTYLVRDPNYKPDKKKKQHTVNYSDLDYLEDTTGVVPLQEYPYERLEFLGDSVLHMVIADYLFTRYPEQDEGFMSRLRTKIENKKTLAWLCREVGLNEFILVSQRMEMYDARNTNDNIMEDSFEAFLGAMYLEYDYARCHTFLVNVIETHFDMATLLRVETNYKDTLLQYHHRMKWRDPTYGSCSVTGPDHKRVYTMYVTDGHGRKLAYGKGGSKRDGEQQAAKNALIHHGQLHDENEMVFDLESDSDGSDTDSEEEMAELYKRLKNSS